MKSFNKSLYLKLLSIYGLTFFLLLVIIACSFKLYRPEGTEKLVISNLKNYAEYLAKDIGSPPDLNAATALHHKTGLDIHIKGPNLKWSSSNEPHDLPWKKHKSIKVTLGDYSYRFSGKHLMSEDIWQVFALILIGLVVILIVSYKLVRKIFKPLDQMKEAIAAFGEGKWDARIDANSMREFEGLALTLNTMAEKIERHFINMRDLLLAISHELRSPLTRMKVGLEFISDPKIKQSLNEEITTLDRMTEMLLERERLSARPELLNKTETDLADFIKSNAALDGIHFHLNPVSKVMLDQARFALAIHNIVDNAFKHGKPPVEIYLKQDASSITLEIMDHGDGIPNDQIQHLGEPFYRSNLARTSSRNAEGYGLGLSLSFSIIKAHGFEIKVTSVPLQETKFVIKMSV
jgi:signal transduction histidine kinase